jgi:hypothetical protein
MLDEAWFYLSIFPSFHPSPDLLITNRFGSVQKMKLRKGTERERTIVSFPQVMLTVVWNPRGFHLLDALPNGSNFALGIISLTSDRHYAKFLILIKMTQDDPRRNFVMRAGDARPYCAKTVVLCLDHNFLGRASYPPYSPDLSPLTSGFSGI